MSSGPTVFEIGATIGDYQIISVIGRGGMGQVFKVRNLLSDRIEAMKVLLPGTDPRPDLVERFQREIKVVAALEHPRIASLRTALRANDQILMIMEYVEGNLPPSRMLQRNNRPGSCGALHHAGPGSSRLCARPRSCARGYQAIEHPRCARRQRQAHRLRYREPQRRSKADRRRRRIGFAFLHVSGANESRSRRRALRPVLVGATLYEMVTGQPPVQGTSFYGILKAHTEGKPRPATELAPHLPQDLSRIIAQSLEKLPEARFQSAGEFQAGLNSLAFKSPPKSTGTKDSRGTVRI